MNRWWLISIAALAALIVLRPPIGAAEKTSPAKEPAATADKKAGKKLVTEPAVFALDEVPAFGKEQRGGTTRYHYPSGAYAVCSPVPNKDVKAYPTLKSKRPMYGSITFDRDPRDPKAGRTFYFVLDESGEKAAAAKDTTKNKGADGHLEVERGPERGPLRYDRLYFDCNGDGDLTNDGVVRVTEKPPFEGMPGQTFGSYFEDLTVTLDFGPDAPRRPFVLVPHALSYGPDMVLIQFFPKTARSGKIRLGGEEYIARLTQSRQLSGRYDRPAVELELAAADPSKQDRLLSGSLGQMRWIDGQYFSLSAAPLGDKLTVAPYLGETGVLEIGAGGRAITNMGLAATFVSRTGVTIAARDSTSPTTDTLPRRFVLPVGDYSLPAFMAQQGRLRFAGRMTTNLDSGLAEVAPAKSPFPIEIRKAKPYVLEFSGKPEVKFMNPAKDASFKPGDNIAIAAMLTEPWQGIQITGLWDTTKKDGTGSITSLDPNIAIRNSTGETVSEGKMPFG